MCTPLASATFLRAAVRETRDTTPAEDLRSKESPFASLCECRVSTIFAKLI